MDPAARPSPVRPNRVHHNPPLRTAAPADAAEATDPLCPTRTGSDRGPDRCHCAAAARPDRGTARAQHVMRGAEQLGGRSGAGGGAGPRTCRAPAAGTAVPVSAPVPAPPGRCPHRSFPRAPDSGPGPGKGRGGAVLPAPCAQDRPPRCSPVSPASLCPQSALERGCGAADTDHAAAVESRVDCGGSCLHVLKLPWVTLPDPSAMS